MALAGRAGPASAAPGGSSSGRPEVQIDASAAQTGALSVRLPDSRLAATGFIVRRSYATVDDPADVSHLPDGRIKIRLGAKVLVSLEVLNTGRRYQVALVDPLPAGFETVNEALATSERAPRPELDSRWDFTNLRDERSEAFALQMAEGVHRFSYTIRAKTPGTFLAAPAKAEEMYSPETFGRSTGETVVIE